MSSHVSFLDGLADHAAFDSPGGRLRGEGHVYVIRFSSQIVKVGRTAAPRTRMRWHLSSAAWYGTTIEKAWLSRPHVDVVPNERALIKYGRERATAQTGNEYFRGVDFADVVRLAESLTYRRATPEPEITFPALPNIGRPLKQVAAATRLSPKLLRRLCRSGAVEHSALPSCSVNGRPYVRRYMTDEQIHALVEMLKNGGEPAAPDPEAATIAREMRRRARTAQSGKANQRGAA
jgi:hypothetical protein